MKEPKIKLKEFMLEKFSVLHLLFSEISHLYCVIFILAEYTNNLYICYRDGEFAFDFNERTKDKIVEFMLK